MHPLDWVTISTIASTVSLIMGGFLWAASRVFGLGRQSERLDATITRLDSIESDIACLRDNMRADKAELARDINAVHHDLNVRMDGLNQRMDKLILALSEPK